MARLCGLIDCLARPPAVTGVPRVQTWVSGQGKIGWGNARIVWREVLPTNDDFGRSPQALAALLRAVFS